MAAVLRRNDTEAPRSGVVLVGVRAVSSGPMVAMTIEVLVAAHAADVWRCLRRFGVKDSALDDATQDVFIVASQKLEKIKAGREKSFLLGVAINVARAQRRKHGREELMTDPDAESFEVAAGLSPEDIASQREELDLLADLLRPLAR